MELRPIKQLNKTGQQPDEFWAVDDNGYAIGSIYKTADGFRFKGMTADDLRKAADKMDALNAA